MSTDAKEFGWPTKRLAGDYARGILGAAFSAFCAILAPAGSWWQIGLLLLLVLFLAFLSDVLIRHGTRVGLTPAGLVRRRPVWGEDRVAWSEIKGLEVRFYPATRDRSRGWLSAKVKGPNGAIAVDDAMNGFEDVVDRAMQAVEAQGIGMDEATMANVASLGLGLRPRSVK